MLNIYLILDLVVVGALVVLALTTLARNYRNRLSVVFALFVLCISVWIISNYISNDVSNSKITATIANYFVFSFSYMASVLLLIFVSYLGGLEKLQRWLRWLTPIFVAVALAAISPLVVRGVEHQDRVYAVLFGPLSNLYFAALFVNIVLVFVFTSKSLKNTRGDQRNRMRTLMVSLYLTFPVLILFQAVIPAALGWFGLTNIGVLPMLILVTGLYYSAIRHRLFDIRFTVARSLGYLLSIGLVIGLSALLLFGISSRLHNLGLSSQWISWIYVALTITLTLVFQPARRGFDKITRRIFFRDAYDTQDFLDEFNQSLVSTIDLSTLLKQAASIIEKYLKPEFCLFAIESDNDMRLIGDNTYKTDTHTIKKITLLSRRLGSAGIISTDSVDIQDDAKELLQKSNIGLFVSLSNPNEAKEKAVGHLIMGNKKSGNIYSSQDYAAITIMANELVIAIQNALRFEEIQQFNLTLQDKVDDATRKLRQTNEKLKKLDETKDDFISMASHQLRTPLTSVKGYVSMVLDGDAGKVSKQQRQLLNQSFVSSERMVALIADLLNVSRLKTGKFVIEPKVTNLVELVNGELAQLTETAKGRGLELVFNHPKRVPDLMIDETKIRQVVMNFVDNAIYYTPSGGKITVDLQDLPKSVELTVTDNGIGVPAHERHHLFTKFYRAKNARKARPDGTGLGLFMAKKVIVASGGALIFESEEGKGSTFGFSFPKDKLAVK